jgi:hypothetical protein
MHVSLPSGSVPHCILAGRARKWQPTFEQVFVAESYDGPSSHRTNVGF